MNDEDQLFTLGQKEGKVIWSRILSLNRRPFEGKLVKIQSGDNIVSLTPEHKVILSSGHKPAEDISSYNKLITLDLQKEVIVEG